MFDKLKQLGSLLVETDDPKKPASVPVAAKSKAPLPPFPSPYVETGNSADNTLPVAGQDSGVASASTLIDREAEENRLNGLIRNHASFKVVADFLDTADTMKNVLKDESTRFQATFEIARAKTNLAASNLVEAAQSVPQILDEEITKFNHGFVEGQEHLLGDLAAESNSLQTQIDAVTKQLGELSNQKSKTDQKLRDSHVALEKAKIDFKSVTDKLTGDYNTLATKLVKYLGGSNGQ